MQEDTETTMRLQKFLSQAGVASRRAAETLIHNGLVFVNGRPATIGQSVTVGVDTVRINGELIQPQTAKRVVLLLNKPRGFLCTNNDPGKGRTVFDLVPPEFATRKLFCIGRLDKDSEGMLLITDDGDIGNRIMHPSGGVVKRYLVTVNRAFDPTLIPRLLKGVKVPREQYVPRDPAADAGDTRDTRRSAPAGADARPQRGKAPAPAARSQPPSPARFQSPPPARHDPAANKDETEFLRFKKVLWDPKAPTRLEVHLEQGRKREIRRLLEVFGFFVKTLFRFQIGGLVMRKMPPGDCRKLSQKEIASILPRDNAPRDRTSSKSRSTAPSRPPASPSSPPSAGRRSAAAHRPGPRSASSTSRG